MATKLRKNRWKQKEDATLKRCIKKGLSVDATASMLGRTPQAVVTRKYTLGVKGRFANPRTSTSQETPTPYQKAAEFQTPEQKETNVAEVIVKQKPQVIARTTFSSKAAPSLIPTTLNVGKFSQKKLNKVVKAARKANATINISFK